MSASFPLEALQAGHWFKLICGASYQHLPVIRNLALTYALAGADCVDVAAEPAVVRSALAGLEVYQQLTGRDRPWLMVSLNDGEDLHFRRAWFNPDRCPTDCPRPCERVCPTDAINSTGVQSDRCYGCGRCLPICPIGLIEAQAWQVDAAALLPELLDLGIEAIEIHTQVGHQQEFQQLWQQLQPWLAQLQAIAISCPAHPEAIAYLWDLHRLINGSVKTVIWQTDGRPMSGDIGAGTTHAAVRFAQTMLTDGPPGHVQLAGGTNAHTVAKLQELQLLAPRATRSVAGIACGGAARTPLADLLEALAEQQRFLEAHPEVLQSAVTTAIALVEPLKQAVSGTTRSIPAFLLQTP
ncbi:circadian clock protein LdpA [Synechococcus elongatus]|uniref:circadian clock protein LdpA n=1 Tax=Synechococcus elongatus TaxID=32046 RepID=UPI0030CD5035